MFSESDKLEDKPYAQSQIDLVHLAQNAHRNSYAYGDI